MILEQTEFSKCLRNNKKENKNIIKRIRLLILVYFYQQAHFIELWQAFLIMELREIEILHAKQGFSQYNFY